MMSAWKNSFVPERGSTRLMRSDENRYSSSADKQKNTHTQKKTRRADAQRPQVNARSTRSLAILLLLLLRMCCRFRTTALSPVAPR